MLARQPLPLARDVNINTIFINIQRKEEVGKIDNLLNTSNGYPIFLNHN